MKSNSEPGSVETAKAGTLKKYIFLAATAVVAVAGYFVRIQKTEVPVWGRVLYSLILIGLAVSAAQGANLQRQQYMPRNDEDEEENGKDTPERNPEKGKRFLYTLVYYLFCLIAVFCIVFSLWFSRILYI